MSDLSATTAGLSPRIPLPTSNSVGLGLGMDSSAEPPNLEITSPRELTQFVDSLLNELESTFDHMAADVQSRLSSISNRVDSLESVIGELILSAPAPIPNSTKNTPSRV